MAKKKPAYSSVNDTATSPPGIDTDKDNCGCLSGKSVLTLKFHRGILLDKKKYHLVNPPSGHATAMAKEEATHLMGITVEIVGIERGLWPLLQGAQRVWDGGQGGYSASS